MMDLNDMYDLNPRELALTLVEEGHMTAYQMLIASLKYMSADDVRDMLDCNELSPRFMLDNRNEVY
jgi:hypothetical protein